MGLPAASQWRKWFLMVRGRSILHVPQGIGRYYSKDDLRGYYNDLTNKYSSKYGSQVLDKNGIPVNQLSNGDWVYFPTSIAQYGLGAYDIWLSTGEEEPYSAFIRCSKWLVDNQDELGGWKVRHFLGGTPDNPYSSMTQGEGASLLYRAGVVSKDKSFLAAADKAIGLMILPIEDGGTARIFDGGIVLEETPNKPGSAILNGWIFSIFGLYDALLVSKCSQWKEAFEKTIDTLEKNLEFYDAGYWSFYDRNGHFASPFYHELHVNLLKVLYALSGKEKFLTIALRWEQYSKNRLNCSRAFLRKAWQKIIEPEEVVLVR